VPRGADWDGGDSVSVTFGSLFAGIGGFDLGFERAGMVCKWQVEIDDYATKTLKKTWPNVRRERDIRSCGRHNLEDVDVVCGGPPCQPISIAGDGKGSSDERWLWGEYLRIIRDLRPRIAIMENPPALLDYPEFNGILASLASVWSCVEWDCVPAEAFGAHFAGDRLFIVASSSEASCLRRKGCWSSEVETNQWGRDEFERLVRVETEHGVPAGSLGRISDGVSNRTHRLRGLGNSIVPQVAEWIGRRILEELEG
jgi:DNA (cytosine-5)-methyltransferase 1